MMLEDIAQRAYEQTRNAGGITVDLQGAEPTSGYAYGGYIELEQVVPITAFTPDLVLKYMQDHETALAMPGHYLGLWHDQQSGNVFMDVSIVAPPGPDALKDAKDRGQIAVWDFDHGVEIPTGASLDRNITSAAWEPSRTDTGAYSFPLWATDHPYYHVAPTIDRQRIMQHGLQPSHPGQSPYWDDVRELVQSQPTGVYMWQHKEDADQYADQMKRKKGIEADVWGVKRPDLPVNDDWFIDSAKVTHEPVRPQHLEMLQGPEHRLPDRRHEDTEWSNNSAYPLWDEKKQLEENAQQWGIGKPNRVWGKVASDHQAVLDTNRGQDLQGLPGQVNVPGHGPLHFGSHMDIQRVANEYNAHNGLGPHPIDYLKVNPGHAARIAQEYEHMSHNPNDPQVRQAYDALAREVRAQYDHAVNNGYQFEFYPDHDPYPNSPREAVLDLHHNKHMYVYPTESGYGQANENPQDHPLLADSGVRWNGRPVTHNDLFRAIHDFYGHAKEGVGFRADGEDNAYRQHAAMFSPQARAALASETRGQNSWVNFGPHGQTNQTAGQGETVYAPQKAGLMPEWTHDPELHRARVSAVTINELELGTDPSHNEGWEWAQHRKPFIYHNGVVHIAEPGAHHGDITRALGGRPTDEHYEGWVNTRKDVLDRTDKNEGLVEGEGFTGWYREPPDREQVDQALRARWPNVAQQYGDVQPNDWHSFASKQSSAWNVIEGQRPYAQSVFQTVTDDMNWRDRRPWVAMGDGRILLGQPGTHHADLGEEFRINHYMGDRDSPIARGDADPRNGASVSYTGREPGPEVMHPLVDALDKHLGWKSDLDHEPDNWQAFAFKHDGESQAHIYTRGPKRHNSTSEPSVMWHLGSNEPWWADWAHEEDKRNAPFIDVDGQRLWGNRGDWYHAEVAKRHGLTPQQIERASFGRWIPGQFTQDQMVSGPGIGYNTKERVREEAGLWNQFGPSLDTEHGLLGDWAHAFSKVAWQLPTGYGITGPQSLEEHEMMNIDHVEPAGICPNCHAITKFPLGLCPHCGFNPRMGADRRQRQDERVQWEWVREQWEDDGGAIPDLDKWDNGGGEADHTAIDPDEYRESKTADMIANEDDAVSVIGQPLYDQWQFSDEAQEGEWTADDVIEWAKRSSLEYEHEATTQHVPTMYHVTTDGQINQGQSVGDYGYGSAVYLWDDERDAQEWLGHVQRQRGRGQIVPVNVAGLPLKHDAGGPLDSWGQAWRYEGDHTQLVPHTTASASALPTAQRQPYTQARTHEAEPIEELRQALGLSWGRTYSESRPSFKALLASGNIRESSEISAEGWEVFSTIPTEEGAGGSIRSPDGTEPEVVEVPTPKDPSHETEMARPMIYSREHNKIWMGSPGSAHASIVRQVSDLNYSPYSGPAHRLPGIHHGVFDDGKQYWYGQESQTWEQVWDKFTKVGADWDGSKWVMTPEEKAQIKINVVHRRGEPTDNAFNDTGDQEFRKRRPILYRGDTIYTGHPGDTHQDVLVENQLDNPDTLSYGSWLPQGGFNKEPGSLSWLYGGGNIKDEWQEAIRNALNAEDNTQDWPQAFSKTANLPIQVIDVPGHDTQGDSHPIVYVPSMQTVFRGAHGSDHWQLVDNSPELTELHQNGNTLKPTHPVNRMIVPMHHGRIGDDSRVHFFDGFSKPEVEDHAAVAEALGGIPYLPNSWDAFAKVAAGNTPYQEGDPIEPWEPGHYGKGMFLRGKPLMWKITDDWGGPHHGDAAYHHDPSESEYPEGYFHIDPKGIVDQEGSHSGLLEQFVAHDPRLSLGEDNEDWRAFSRVAHVMEIPQHEKPDFEDPTERPYIYDRATGIVHLGHPGDSHSRVYEAIEPGLSEKGMRPNWNTMLSGAINPDTGMISEYSDHKKMTPKEKMHVYGLLHQHLGVQPIEPGGDWGQAFSKVSGRSQKEWERLRARLEQELGPSQSKVVHQWDDGFTVQQHQTPEDVQRVGHMMANCWQNPKNYKPHGKFWTLHDPMGRPKLAVDEQEGKLSIPLGAWNHYAFKHNGVPDGVYSTHIKRLAEALEPLGYDSWNGYQNAASNAPWVNTHGFSKTRPQPTSWSVADGYSYGKVADSLNGPQHNLVWEPGWPGKGFYHNGELTTWGINTTNHFSGWPHHTHMWDQKYPGEDLSAAIKNSAALMLNIEPDGQVREAHPYKGEWPEEMYQIEPRFKRAGEGNPWGQFS